MRDAGEFLSYSQLMSTSQNTSVHHTSRNTVEVTLLPPKADVNKSLMRRLFTTTAPATFDKVAIIAAALGGLVGAGLCICFRIPSLGAYMVATGIFHLLEFWVTARFNSEKLGMASFLLTNGIEYAAAQLFAASEYLIRWYYFGRPPIFPSYLFVSGLITVFSGQFIRTRAMIQAAASFSHFLQSQRKEDHVLVRHGLYAVMRHPSYTGFYVWAIGSQIMLHNAVSTVLFASVLLHFFTLRIRDEEKSLVRFFGKDYIDYRAQVWSGIPFIS